MSGGRALDVSPFDADVLRAAEYLTLRGGSALICPADPLLPTSAVVAAAVHVGAMIRDYSSSRRASPSPLRVAVVTTDYRARGFYRRLAVRELRGNAAVGMRTVVPAATRRADGSVSVIDRDDRRWATVFVDSVDAIGEIDGLDLVVVDLPAAGADTLVGSGIPTVVIARDPSDQAAIRLAEQMPVVGYDWAINTGIGVGDNSAASSVRMVNRACRDLRMVSVLSPSLCSEAGLFWGDIAPLLRLSGRSPLVRKLIEVAFGIFHDLIGLAMPTRTFEQLTARPWDSRIEELARTARVLKDRELREDWLPMVEAELAGLLDALRAGERKEPARHAGYPTKAAVLQPVIADALDDHKDVLVVTRTAQLCRVYKEYLSEEWPSVRVAPLGELATTPPADVAVLLGMAPSWGRWVYRSGIGREMAVLAYTDDDSIAPRGDDGRGATGVFDEATIVRSAVDQQIWAGMRMSTPAQRAKAVASLRSHTRIDGSCSMRCGGDTETSVVARTFCPPEVPPGLWDGDGWIAPIEPGTRDRSAGSTQSDIAEVGPGARIVFDDGSWVWLHDRSPVQRWRRNSRLVEKVDTFRLCVGDTVIFVDGDVHKTLVGKVLEVSSEVPELAVAGAWVEHWRATLGRALRRHDSYAGLARALRGLGCAVQTQTVRLWCVGTTLGPEDMHDVRRLGELVGDQALRVHYTEIARAMRTIRAANIRLGRRLKRMTQVVGPAVLAGDMGRDEIVDETSGLTAADFAVAVSIVLVVRIDRYPSIPTLLVGSRRQADDPVDLIEATTETEVLL